MQLEWLAGDATAGEVYDFDIQSGSENMPRVIDTRPLIRAVAVDARNCIPTNIIARRFHTTLVEIVATVCRGLAPNMESMPWCSAAACF